MIECNQSDSDMNELLLATAAETEEIMGVWCGKCKTNEQESDTNIQW